MEGRKVCQHDLVDIHLRRVEVRAIHQLGELGVEADDEVEHPTVDLGERLREVRAELVVSEGR